MDRITVTPVGTKGMQARINGMSGSVSGAVMRPVVADAAGQLRGLAVSLAPRRTGKGRQGIISDLMKIGKGYCYYWVRLDPTVFYMRFHEFGLGTGASNGVKAKTRRAHERYAARRAAGGGVVVRQRTRTVGRFDAATQSFGFQRVAGPHYLKKTNVSRRGQPHNMAAHPFLRPAVSFTRVTLSRYMLEGIAANALRWTSPQ